MKKIIFAVLISIGVFFVFQFFVPFPYGLIIGIGGPFVFFWYWLKKPPTNQEKKKMKDKLLKIGIILFVFGLGNFLFTYGYFAYFGDTSMILLFPFAGTKSGNVPDPIMSLIRCDDCIILDGIISRLGEKHQDHSVIENFTYSYWELIWSLSFYIGIISLTVWKIRT